MRIDSFLNIKIKDEETPKARNIREYLRCKLADLVEGKEDKYKKEWSKTIYEVMGREGIVDIRTNKEGRFYGFSTPEDRKKAENMLVTSIRVGL